jgi:hypothetical protein
MNPTDRLNELFEAERTQRPSAEQSARGWDRLTSALSEHATPLSVAMGPLQLGTWTAVKIMGTALVVGTVVAGGVAVATVSRRADTHRAVPAIVVQTESLPKPVNAVPRSLSSTEPVLPEVKSPTVTQPAPAASLPTFDAELSLIKQAKRDLDQGHPHLARVWLEEHRARFARGSFAGERDGLLVLIDCSISQSGTAGAQRRAELAKTFEQTHPGSPLIDRIDRACGLSGAKAPAPVAPSANAFPSEIDK